MGRGSEAEQSCRDGTQTYRRGGNGTGIYWKGRDGTTTYWQGRNGTGTYWSGFSPVWIRRWMIKLLLVRKERAQNSQM